MRDVTMRATRRTRVGVLREGKYYSVPDDVAGELIESGAAHAGSDVGSGVVEAAVNEPPEHAAKRTTRARGRSKAAGKSKAAAESDADQSEGSEEADDA